MQINLKKSTPSVKPAESISETSSVNRIKLLRQQRLGKHKVTFGSVNSTPAKKPKKAFKIAKLVVLLLLVGGVVAALFWGYKKAINVINAFGINVTGEDVIGTIKNEKPELKKDSSGKYTNALLVGIDTRSTQPGLQNTDTIVIASFNHDTKETVMYSIPRDMYVDYPDGYGRRINAVYSVFENDEKGTGMEGLKGAVEEFTGLEIQYYALVDYDGFSKVVDIVGGITVNVENSFTDYAYPKGDGYEVIHFDAGPQTMDGTTALKYARSRKSQQNGEGSDYARARRQQKVIKAIRDKVLSTETLLDANKILDMITELQKNIKLSSVSLREIQAGLELADQVKDGKVYTFVFDPLIANGQLIENDPNSFLILPSEGLGKYANINSYVSQVELNPKLYEEDALIRVYDTGMGYTEALAKVKELQAKYPYLSIIYQGTLYYDKTDTYAYINSAEGDFSATLTEISAMLGTVNTAKPAFITTVLNAEDFTILLGEPVPVPTETAPTTAN